MPSEKILSFESAYNRLQEMLSDKEPCKKIILEFANWIQTFNNQLTSDNQFFPFKREAINVAYALERNKKQETKNKKTKYPNFLVIKLKEEIPEFKTPHLDFSLGENGYAPLSHLLTQRKNSKHSTRWVVQHGILRTSQLDDLKELFLEAFRKKGGTFSEDSTLK